MNFHVEVRMETTGHLILDSSSPVQIMVPRIGEKISTNRDVQRFVVVDVDWKYSNNGTLATVTVKKFYP